MIEKEFALGQLHRMMQLDFPPTTTEQSAEVVMSICTADTEDIAVRVIDDIMSDRTEFPKPSEIRRLLFEMSDRKHKPPPWEGTERPAVKEKNGYRCGYVCEGWGTVGQRPNVKFCTCDHADWLRREIPNWLELANQMPANNPLTLKPQPIPPWLSGMPD